MLARLLLMAGFFFGSVTVVFAQSTAPVVTNGSEAFISAALLFFFPLGLLLFLSSAVPDDFAPAAAVTLLVAWSVAVLAYFSVGFAFNFGGVAQAVPNPEFSALYWEWYPLDQSVDVEVARLWGVIALRGWALAIDDLTPAVWLLFLNHLALVGAVAMIPAAALVLRERFGAALLAGLVTGGLVYPVAGNWLWGGGWLSNVGISLGMGRGFLDFGGVSIIFLAGSAVTLAGLLTYRRAVVPDKQIHFNEHSLTGGFPPPAASAGENPSVTPLSDSMPMPAAYLPILSTLGSGVLLLGWLGLAVGMFNPASVAYSVPQAAASGIVTALAAALTAGAYSWFTTSKFNPLMAGRGLVAGLIVAAAGAAFAPVWTILVAGLLMGLALAPLIYLFEHKTPLHDETATLATMGVSALVGLSLVGLTSDAEAQLQAQLLGSAAIFAWAFLVSGIGFQLYRVVERVGRQTMATKDEVLPTTPGDEEQSVGALGPRSEQTERG